MTLVVPYDAKGEVLRFEAWNRVNNREGTVYAQYPTKFKLPWQYRKSYTYNYQNIEIYVKFSSILNRLVPRRHSKCCPIGFKSTIEI